MSQIHPTAIVSASAKVADTVKIGAYAIVEDDVEIGENSVIYPHAHVYSGAVIGAGCQIHGFATVSGLPQDLHFDASLKTYVKIGDGTVVREGATIHRATFDGKATLIGKNCYLMAYAHVGHDCVVGDNVIIATYAALAGHVKADNCVFVSGGVMLHQRIRVGEGAMISGNSAASCDVPPYVNALERNYLQGINLIGLSRRGVPRASIANIKEAYAAVYTHGGNPITNAKRALEAGLAKSAEAEKFLRFFTDVEGRHFLRLKKD